MSELQEKNINLVVVKRDGKKVDFNGAKIALAIKKGFDSVKSEEDETVKYTEKDVHKVYEAVIDRLEEFSKEKEKVKIEEIQDMIEEQLEKLGYEDVFKSFRDYRERRTASRKLFFDEKYDLHYLYYY